MRYSLENELTYIGIKQFLYNNSKSEKKWPGINVVQKTILIIKFFLFGLTNVMANPLKMSVRIFLDCVVYCIVNAFSKY